LLNYILYAIQTICLRENNVFYEQQLIHLVDVGSHELLHSWMVHVKAVLPDVDRYSINYNHDYTARLMSPLTA